MKKIFQIIIVLYFSIYLVNASNITNKLYKESIISRSYIRHNIKSWEKILKYIELYFNDIRKYKNIEKLKNLNNKTKYLLLKYKNKGKLTQTEKHSFELIKNLFYRSYIELQRKY